MADQPFMLVSLEEAKAKRLAQVLNNETCTKILNWLSSHKEGTETEIAKKLQLPLSTVHYNLKQLVEAKLVTADEYHYSEKGREVLHYKLANKYIIIAPEEGRSSFMEKLQQFIPAAVIVAVVGVVLKVLGLLTGSVGSPESAGRSDIAAPQGVVEPLAEKSARTFAEDATSDAGAMMLRATNESVNGNVSTNMPYPPPDFGGSAAQQPFLSNEVILAFVVGGLFAIFLIALLTYLRKRRK